MKRFLILAGLATATILFTGCGGGGGGGGGGYVPPPSTDVLYLDDITGAGMGGVEYNCDSGTGGWTDPDGAFYFYWGDACTFDLYGFSGSAFFSLHIDDGNIQGVGGIPFDCASGWNGSTYGDGSFEYDMDDICTFYF